MKAEHFNDQSTATKIMKVILKLTRCLADIIFIEKISIESFYIPLLWKFDS